MPHRVRRLRAFRYCLIAINVVAVLMSFSTSVDVSLLSTLPVCGPGLSGNCIPAPPQQHQQPLHSGVAASPSCPAKRSRRRSSSASPGPQAITRDGILALHVEMTERKNRIVDLKSIAKRLAADSSAAARCDAPAQGVVVNAAPPSSTATKRLWRCNRTRFHSSEDTHIAQLIGVGVFTRNPDFPNAPPTMASVHSGQYLPALEPLLKPVTKREVDLITRESRCLRRKDTPPHRIVMCAVVQNRVKLTAEWIQYHRLLGVEFFHIWDLNSEDGLADRLSAFTEAGVLIVETAPQPPYSFMGMPAPSVHYAARDGCIQYQRAHKKRSNRVTWIAMFDVDEFLVTPACIPDFVDSVLVAAPDRSVVGALAVGWSQIGHDAENFDKLRTVFESTHYFSGELHPAFKSMVRADAVVAFSTLKYSLHAFQLSVPHQTIFQDGTVAVVNGTFLPADEHRGRAVLAHYHTRSLTSSLRRVFDNPRLGADPRSLNDMIGIWRTFQRDGWITQFDHKFKGQHQFLLRGLGHQTSLNFVPKVVPPTVHSLQPQHLQKASARLWWYLLEGRTLTPALMALCLRYVGVVGTSPPSRQFMDQLQKEFLSIAARCKS